MIVQLCPFVKLFAYGEGFTTTINLKCMVLHVDHWLVDIWLKQGRERQWSSPRMREAQKTQSKNRQQYKKHRLQWTVFIIFVSQFHFSSLYVRTLTFSTAGCQASNSTSKSGPQTSCTTQFWHWLRAVRSLPQTAYALLQLNWNSPLYVADSWSRTLKKSRRLRL